VVEAAVCAGGEGSRAIRERESFSSALALATCLGTNFRREGLPTMAPRSSGRRFSLRTLEYAVQARLYAALYARALTASPPDSGPPQQDVVPPSCPGRDGNDRG